MLLITTALHCEAKPLIKRYNLKKLHKPGRFEVYNNENVFLAVSGVGMINSAAALAHIATLATTQDIELMLNIGICGCSSAYYPVGQAILANKIINTATKRCFYPDILFNHILPEGTVATYLSPVTSECRITEAFVDMEAAGFFEAASAFTSPHKIQCIKIVSDHLEGSRIDQTFVNGIIENNLAQIDIITNEAGKTINNYKTKLTDNEYELIKALTNNLKLTETMKLQLEQAIMRFKARNNQNPDCLNAFAQTKTGSKKEGKIIFEQIRSILGK